MVRCHTASSEGTPTPEGRAGKPGHLWNSCAAGRLNWHKPLNHGLWPSRLVIMASIILLLTVFLGRNIFFLKMFQMLPALLESFSGFSVVVPVAIRPLLSFFSECMPTSFLQTSRKERDGSLNSIHITASLINLKNIVVIHN